MTLPLRRALAMVLPGLVLGLWALLVAVLVWMGMDEGQKTALGRYPETAVALIVVAWMVGAALLAQWALALFRHHVDATARLREDLQVVVSGTSDNRLETHGDPELRKLAGVIDELVAQRRLLQQDMQRQVQSASEGVDRERRRLAALMAELDQSVVVCNLDGRILLYNHLARQQYQRLSGVGQLADGAAAIGLGRSIYAVFDRQLVNHALDSIMQQLTRDGGSPSAQFVTTTSAGRLLRVRVAAVMDNSAGADRTDAIDTGPRLDGFVLMADDLTVDYEQQSGRDQLLHGLTEGSRSALANLQAAVEMLELPDIEPAMRARFMDVIREETLAMGQRLQSLAQAGSQGLATRWPMEDMLGADLVSAAARRIELVAEIPVGKDSVDHGLWLKVDSFSLVQALAYLAWRLKQEHALHRVDLRLASDQGHAQLDLAWSSDTMHAETMMAWERDTMQIGDQVTPLRVRDVVDRHAGAFWFECDRARHECWFRFLIPLAQAHQPQTRIDRSQAHASRPEFYDFDLFRTSDMSPDLLARRLDALSYTVFDTETTGLDPAGGDEIIQIGATRIVNGKLLHHEAFEQLVDPGRPIPPASTRIHGIGQEMVEGQPPIAEVLTAFHAYAQDTVLVAHNAAFDMRFLQLKEATSGVVFTQPVLDTLLLSELAHPNQPSHALEAIAERLGVAVVDRHTALGDAKVTAEVFLRLLPMLQAQGLETLEQLLAAARNTRSAQVRY